jgi:hypothetical protein
MWEMVTGFSTKLDVVLVTPNIDCRSGKPSPDELTHDHDSIDGVSATFVRTIMSGRAR